MIKHSRCHSQQPLVQSRIPVSSLINGWQVTTVDCGHQPFIIISLSLSPLPPAEPLGACNWARSPCTQSRLIASPRATHERAFPPSQLTSHFAQRSALAQCRVARDAPFPPSTRSGGRADICARARLQHDRTSKGAPCAPSKPSHSTAFPAPLTVEDSRVEGFTDDSSSCGLITSTLIIFDYRSTTTPTSRFFRI
jgi:hypothetical protein